ncbi:MAG: TrkH family potassium uptake protein [Peptococcaceae bacterium]|nr:TrkH family potassium uptake protein [Peptococcaceae bacterium]
MPRINLNPHQVLVLGFLIVILTGAILLSTPWAAKDGSIDFLTALFTATSAVCVTGLVVVDTVNHWSLYGQTVIMLLIQVGGLGIMSFATFFALLLGKKIQLKQRILMQQALNKPSLEGVVNIFRHLLLFSFIIEAIGAAILTVNWAPSMGMPKALWYGIFHAISAFNNAGFDLMGNFSSLTGFTGDLVTNLVISSLLVTGGLGFIVLYEVYSYKRTGRLSVHSKVVLLTTAALIVSGTALILVSEYNHALSNLPASGKVMASYFQAVTPRTAGFNTIDLNSLYISTQLFIIFLMFVGASPGSTGGGIKTTTFTLLWLAIYSNLRGKKDTQLFKRSVKSEEVFRALSIALLALFFVFAVTFLLSLSHQADFIKILFEVVSALGTVGLSLGLTTELNDFGRILIIITMFAGRLGPLTLGYAFIYQKRQPDLKYPATKIMVG